MTKERLDLLLLERELTANREESQRLIRAGKVLVNEVVIDKPGTKISIEQPIRIIERESRYVSRGGLKMEEALNRFQVDVKGKIAADLGASTGGFTDCLLKHGITKVYAIDVGHGQLDYRLQCDDRVIVMDRTNCRYLKAEDLGERVDLITADLSFIGVKTVFPAMTRIVHEVGSMILLIKPQFEIGKGKVGKKGIVKLREDHREVLEQCRDFFHEHGWWIHGLAPSPILGKTGNIEFLFYLAKRENPHAMYDEFIQTVVEEAHRIRKGGDHAESNRSTD